MAHMTIPGIQNDTELDIIAYGLFTTNEHSFGYNFFNINCSSVVYHPRNIGVNDISAGSIHTLANIKKTVFCVISRKEKLKKWKKKILESIFCFVCEWHLHNGYSSGRTMAKYLHRKSILKKNRKIIEILNLNWIEENQFTYRLIYNINAECWLLKNTHPSYSTHRT